MPYPTASASFGFDDPIQALVARQRTLNQRGNPALRPQGAAGMINQKIPGALTTSGVPDMFEAEDNLEFWDNNARLTAAQDPGSGSWRASAGPHPSPIGRAMESAGAMQALKAQQSPGMAGGAVGGGGKSGGQVTYSEGGNYSRGPAVSDDDLQTQHWAQKTNEARASMAEGQARDANKTSEEKLADEIARQKATNTQQIQSESEQTIQRAKTQYDPTVWARGDEARRLSEEQSDEAQFIQKYKADAAVREAEAKARGLVDVQEGKSGTAVDVENIRSGAKIASGTPFMSPEDRDALFKQLYDDYMQRKQGAGQPVSPTLGQRPVGGLR